jgi:hypothetical protein
MNDAGVRALLGVNQIHDWSTSPIPSTLTVIGDQGGAATVTASAQLDGVATFNGKGFAVATQTGALEIDLADGKVAGEIVSFKMPADVGGIATTIKNAAGVTTLVVLTPTATVAPSVLLIWSGTAWVPFWFGDGAA